jgi:hypothetical protein
MSAAWDAMNIVVKRFTDDFYAAAVRTPTVRYKDGV